MSKNWRHTKKFIDDWAKIWICCISLVAFINMMSFVHSYAAVCKNELQENFVDYCVETMEREVNKYE